MVVGDLRLADGSTRLRQRSSAELRPTALTLSLRTIQGFRFQRYIGNEIEERVELISGQSSVTALALPIN
jgi:hypothetical protein